MKGLERDDLENFEKNITSFDITLSNTPNKNDNFYTLKSQEYPSFIFEIKESSFQSCNNSLDENFKQGDVFNIGIKASIYNSKILKNIEPSFWTKHFNWKYISVYDLNINGNDIINKKVVREKLEDQTNYFSLFLGLFFFACFLLGLLMYFTLP